MGSSKRGRFGWWSIVSTWLVWLAAGCAGGSHGTTTGGSGQLGDRCRASEDCESLICVRLNAETGVCSAPCTTDATCPTSDNWACLASPTIQASVCACLPLGDTEVCGDGVDNDCNGKVDDCQMCGGRPVPRDDPDHCGSCEHACRSDQRCERGECECPLDSALECEGRCTDAKADPSNCGACGVGCGPSRVCKAGDCACPATSMPDFCPDIGCLNLNSDANNCGTCDAGPNL